MKHLLRFTFLLSILLVSSLVFSQRNKSEGHLLAVKTSDTKMIVGSWTGSITYLDYGSGKPFTMPANLTVKLGKKSSILLLHNQYPNEPKANSTDKLKITKNGTHIDKAMIVSRKKLPDGSVLISAQKKGKDDNKKAVIRYTYTLGEDQFIIRKDVKFENSNDWIQRNEFSYSR